MNASDLSGLSAVLQQCASLFFKTRTLVRAMCIPSRRDSVRRCLRLAGRAKDLLGSESRDACRTGRHAGPFRLETGEFRLTFQWNTVILHSHV